MTGRLLVIGAWIAFILLVAAWGHASARRRGLRSLPSRVGPKPTDRSGTTNTRRRS